MGRGKAPAFYHRERKVLGHSLVGQVDYSQLLCLCLYLCLLFLFCVLRDVIATVVDVFFFFVFFVHVIASGRPSVRLWCCR